MSASVNSGSSSFAGQVRVVGGEVEVAVAAEAEEDHPLLARLGAASRLVDRRAERVGGLGRRDDALGAREPQRRGEGLGSAGRRAPRRGPA